MHLLEIYGFHSPGASQEGEKGGASPKQPVSWDSSSREPVDSVKDSSAVLSDIPWPLPASLNSVTGFFSSLRLPMFAFHNPYFG